MARVAVVALSVALLALSGCEYRKFSVVIPNLIEDEIAGIQMWRMNDAGQFVEAGAMEVSSPFLENGVLVVTYQMVNPDGSRGLEFNAAIEPVGENSSRLTLWFARWALPGQFKASLWNAAGDGSLSDEAILL